MRIPGHVHFTRALVFVYDIPDIRTFYLSASVNSHMICCVIFGTSLLFAFYDLFKSLAACVNIRRVKSKQKNYESILLSKLSYCVRYTGLLLTGSAYLT